MAQAKNSKRELNAYAFIDSQNINLGVQSLGWKLDWRKFRQYLRNKYGVKEAFLFIGFKADNETLYTDLQNNGYTIIHKPTMELPDGTVKGNVDAELVLHAMIQSEHYEKAVIASGDGDFHCLVEYLAQQGKLLHILAPNRHYSKLLREFNDYVICLDRLKHSLEYNNKKTKISGRSKP